MLILNLLTGTASTGVSVSKDGEILIAISIETGIRQSETIFKMIKDAFSYIDYSADDIDAVSTLEGPGSFTGLRVGLAAAKAICFAKNIPIIMVNTNDAIFAENEYDKDVLTLMDARRDRFYAKFHKNYNQSKILSLDDIPLANGDIIAVGEGILKYKTALQNKGYIVPQIKDVYLTIKGFTNAANKIGKDSLQDSMNAKLDYLKKNEDVVTISGKN